MNADAATIEGTLSIDLYRRKGKIIRADIRSSRPIGAASILVGRPAGKALEIIPLMYRVCATAQAAAAVRACQQALGRTAAAAVETARDMLVLVETAREHLWRIALDWPQILGERAESGWAAALSSSVGDMQATLFGKGKGRGFSLDVATALDAGATARQIDALRSIIEKQVFAMPPERWLDGLDETAWRRWVRDEKTPAARLAMLAGGEGWRRRGAAATRFLPRLDAGELHRRLSASDADSFVARPDWQSLPHETTSLARNGATPLIAALLDRAGDGMETRLAAKLVELASIPGRLDDMAGALDNGGGERPVNDGELPAGVGIGQVEAARGRLTHWLRMENDRLADYRIVAPTEWNFHPDGALARGLVDLPGEDEQLLRRQAELLIKTVDPCVGYELTVH